MSEEDKIRLIVQEVLDHRDEALKEGRRWWTGMLVAGFFSIMGMMAFGTTRLIQNDTRLANHMGDGHPEAVRQLVRSNEKLLVEIRTNQLHIIEEFSRTREDISELKKKLNDL